jgi:phosphoribosyl 1,2-cyclic phosphodiesterase
MQISLFASGSSGNCSAVFGDGSGVLIDAGISLRRITAGLGSCGASPEELGGVLVTHEHTDHVSGLAMLSRHFRLPIYTTRTIAAKLRGMLPDTDGLINVIEPDESFKVGSFSVTAFRTPHDSADSVGYRVEDGAVLGFATDTGCITDEMLGGLSGADTAVIEANHDERMLRYGAYPVFLKRRILADTGHLSNDSCGELARRLAEGGTRRIILGHLSRENNRPETARETVEAALEGSGAELYVAPAAGLLTVPVEEGARICCR